MEYRPNEDIFETGADVIVNPVNCQVHKLYERQRKNPERFPTAQKGLAAAFEERYPGIQAPLENACAKGQMKPGSVQMIGVNRKTGERAARGDADLMVANIATKDHWQDPSKLEWVDRGLEKLAGAVETRGIKSIAIPMLGAGFGKLPWSDVRVLIERHFKPLAEKGVQVTVMGEGPKKEISKEASDKTIAEQKKAAAPSSAGAEGEGEAEGEDDARQISTPGQATRSADTKYYAGIGARDTPQGALDKMRKIGKILAGKGIILRSGGATGADSAFEEGCDEADPSAKEIFLPFDGFDPKRDGNKRYANGTTVFSDAPSKGHVELARKYHPKFDQLGDGVQKLHARNGSQMMGRKLDSPSNLVLCWTKDGKTVGGTGQALRIAEDKGIPVINLGDSRFRSMSAVSVARVAMDVASGKALGGALAMERARAKREDAMEM